MSFFMAKRPPSVKLNPLIGLKETGIASNESEFVKVSIKGMQDAQESSTTPTPATLPPKGTKFTGQIEKKGRGQSPVAVIRCANPEVGKTQLSLVLKELKVSLACGGTLEDLKIVIQCPDHDRVSKQLQKYGFTYTPSGG
jgi:translation initiation factor 1 (eIF-1/SUI1)